MSAPKHTAGDWVFGSREGWRVDAPTHYSSHYTLVAKGRRAPIAFVVSTARDEDEYHANARLIAAAPDTTRELARLADLFEHALATPGYGQDANSAEEAASALADARAAIAKATGEGAS